jgi:phospholipid/cholesterol/gamma-HCH transport system permease protein
MGVGQLQLSGDVYLQYSKDALDTLDVLSSMVKGAVFGGVIGLIATFKGFRARQATEAVGESTTATMVLCVLWVLLADVVLAKFFLLIGG